MKSSDAQLHLLEVNILACIFFNADRKILSSTAASWFRICPFVIWRKPAGNCLSRSFIFFAFGGRSEYCIYFAVVKFFQFRQCKLRFFYWKLKRGWVTYFEVWIKSGARISAVVRGLSKTGCRQDLSAESRKRIFFLEKEYYFKTIRNHQDNHTVRLKLCCTFFPQVNPYLRIRFAVLHANYWFSGRRTYMVLISTEPCLREILVD